MSSKYWRFAFSIRSLGVFVAIVAFVALTWKLSRDLGSMRSEVRRLESQLYKNQTIQVEYGSFVVAEVDSQLYGLRLSRSVDRDVDYEWYKLDATVSENEEKGESYLERLKKNGEWANGTTNETQGESNIPIGPITVPWSSGGKRWGWIYLSEIDEPIRIYSRQLYESDLDNLTFLDEELWILTKPRN